MTEQCAVWYQRYGATYYELASNERVAAGIAWHMEDRGEGYPLGVQFSDGRIVERDAWTALSDYEESMMRAIREAPTPEPRPTRKILSPFGSDTVAADYDDPPWLGSGVSRG